MRTIVCFCEHSFDADIPDLISIDENKNTIDSILNGDFMNIKCPKCKTLLKPELPFKLIDTSRGIDLFFIPEIDRTSFLIDKLPYKIDSSQRVVIGYKELVEKITILINNLNDQAIELIKYYILSKAKEHFSGDEISIYFNEKKSNIFYFYIEGLKKDEIAQYEIKFDFYQKILNEIDNKLKDPTFSAFLQPPYVSLNKVYME